MREAAIGGEERSLKRFKNGKLCRLDDLCQYQMFRLSLWFTTP
jgi:hypothetical protein